ncbi:MAG: hypothetical protein ACLFWB_12875 [Armatimonadota bacterium]
MTANLPLPIIQAIIVCLLMFAIATHTTIAQTTELDNGFRDHGPFSHAARCYGMVCSEDAAGDPVVLAWLFDHRGAYALAVIDAWTGEIEEIPRPMSGRNHYASVLGSNGRYYTYFGSHFLEFDPQKREFTVVQEGPPLTARSMTEDDDGVIWAALSFDSYVVSYDPKTGEFRNWGKLHDHPSLQFPGQIQADDRGWIYIAIGLAVRQIFMLNPDTGEVSRAIEEDEVMPLEETRIGMRLYRDRNGKVYARTPADGNPRQWYLLYDGQAAKLDVEPEIDEKPIIAGHQGLKHRDLPNGERVKELDLVEGRLVVENPETGETREMEFQTSAEGHVGMGVAAAPDGTLAGGTYIPHRFFNYDPQADTWVRHDSPKQWNAVTSTDDMFYVATYAHGDLLQWDPSREWTEPATGDPNSNPRFLVRNSDANRQAQRPYTLLAHPDGRQIIYGGMPGYGSTGGGLVFYDRHSEAVEVIPHEDLLPWHCIASLEALPHGTIVGGSSIQPARGGVQKADVAELFLMDSESRKLLWHDTLLDGAERYCDLHVGPEGVVFGIADRTRLFVFDPAQRAIVHEVNVEPEFGETVHAQAPRIFIQTPDGRIFLLFKNGIVQLDPETYELRKTAEAPRDLYNGGAYLGGRLYFGAGVHLYSWEVPPAVWVSQ